MREFPGEYGRGVRQENVRSKTKELTGTLSYALSMCPTTITASSEEREDVTTACLNVHAYVAQRGTAVRVQTIYKKNDSGRKTRPQERELIFLASRCFGRCSNWSEWWKFRPAESVSNWWLNQTNDQLKYKYSDACYGNFLKRILTRVLDFLVKNQTASLYHLRRIIGSVWLQMGTMGTMISRMRMRMVLQDQLKRTKAKNHSR